MATRRANSRFAALLKLLISVALLALIAAEVDLASMGAAVARIPVWLIAASLLILTLQGAVLAWRWHRILRWMGGGLSLGSSATLTWLGLFLNQALPGSVGGDIGRAWGATRVGVASDIAIGSVVVDRITGIISVAALAVIGLMPTWSTVQPISMRYWLITPLPLVVAAATLIAILSRIEWSWIPGRVAPLVRSASASLIRLARSPLECGEFLVLGAAAAAVGIAQPYLLGRELGLELGFPAYLMIVGGAAIVSVIPVSFGGWGVRDGVIVVLFAALGVSMEDALLVSVAYGLTMTVVALPGGLFWLADWPRR